MNIKTSTQYKSYKSSFYGDMFIRSSMITPNMEEMVFRGDAPNIDKARIFTSTDHTYMQLP